MCCVSGWRGSVLSSELGAAPPARHSQGNESADIRAFGRGAFLATTGAAVGALLQFVVLLVFTHGLSAESAGTLLETIAFFTIVSAVTDSGADVGLVREIGGLAATGRTAGLRNLLKHAFVPVAVVGILAAVASFVAAHFLAELFFDSAQRANGATYIRIVAPAIPLAALTTLALATMRGLGTVAPFVAIQNLGIPALRLALVAIAVGVGLGGASVISAWTLPVAFGALAAFLVVGRALRQAEAQTPPSRGRAGEWPEFIRFWRFAAPRGLASVLDISVLMLDVLLVGALRSARDAAVYAAASRLILFGTLLLVAVSRPLAPQFSGLLARGRVDAVKALYHVATWWTMIIGWPVFVTCAIFAPAVMSVFGTGYSSGATALLILSLACLFDLATGNMNPLLLMSGKSSWNLFNSILALSLNVSLNVALIPSIGITGAAIAWAASIAANNVAAIFEIRVLLGLRPFNRTHLLLALGIGACYGAVGLAARLVLGDELPVVLATLAVGTVLYAPLLYRWRESLRLHDLAAGLRPSAA
jgi:O-antigen/teichoic acid export membrane protein